MSFSGVGPAEVSSTKLYGGVVALRGIGATMGGASSRVGVTGRGDFCVGVIGLGYEKAGVTGLLNVDEVGEAIPFRGGEFLPTLSGTIGLMRSSCVSLSRTALETVAVSATTVGDTARSDSLIIVDTGLRGTCSGFEEGSSLSGEAICDRPEVRLNGSTEPGNGRPLRRLTRSARLIFLLSGPLIEVLLPIVNTSTGPASLAKVTGFTEDALPAWLEVGSPE